MLLLEVGDVLLVRLVRQVVDPFLGAEALKGDLSSKDKVRAELKKANFKSLRGDFKYNTNNFPIQNFYIQEAVKDADGVMTVKTIATAVTAAKDPYYEKCSMK